MELNDSLMFLDLEMSFVQKPKEEISEIATVPDQPLEQDLTLFGPIDTKSSFNSIMKPFDDLVELCASEFVTVNDADDEDEGDGPYTQLIDSSIGEEVPMREQRQRDWRKLKPTWNGSVGTLPPSADEPGAGDTINSDEAFEQTLVAKPSSAEATAPKKKVLGRRAQWRSRKTRSRLNLASGSIEPCATVPERRTRATSVEATTAKNFEDLTIGELRQSYEAAAEQGGAIPKCWFDFDVYETADEENEACDENGQPLNLWEDEEDKPAEVLGFSWRSEPETYGDEKWVKVKTVIDSGASAPVAPPSMLPNCKNRPSEGSKRGQKYTSASKHKIKNLGEQHCKAYTEDGEATEVLFQIADVSKPLVSVAAICEKGNRVIFGKSGGVVQNLYSGRQIPFRRENGIYILSMWLLDGDDEGFGRP